MVLVILQTFPPLQTSPRKICNGAEKPLHLPPLQSFPPYHFNCYRFYLYIFTLLLVILWKTEYITENYSFIINCHIFEQTFSVHPKMRIRNFTKMGEGLQCCRSSPRGRSAMKGGISAMLQTFPLGGRSATLQTFRGGGLQGGRSAIQHRNTKLTYTQFIRGFIN